MTSIIHNSPSSEASLAPYLDFLLYNPTDKQILLSEYLQGHRGQQVPFKVYNMVTQETREVTIAVKGGTTTREIIGADLRFERYTDVHQKVYRVSHI